MGKRKPSTGKLRTSKPKMKKPKQLKPGDAKNVAKTMGKSI